MQVQHNKKGSFVLGLFGDTMQRIYLDGKERLNEIIPVDWSKPCKIMNHRSQKRIVDLINDIRFDVDEQKQQSREDKSGGVIHLFIANSDNDKSAIEDIAMHNMVEITADAFWNEKDKCKFLTLEHHIASKRLKFDCFFNPLYRIDAFKTGLLDGTLSGVNFFIKYILPLVNANKDDNQFEIARIVRTYSPIFKESIKNKNLSAKEIQLAKKCTEELFSLWGETEPCCLEILQCIAKNGLFEIPNSLYTIASRNAEEQSIAESPIESNTDDINDSDENKINAWDEALNSHFCEIERYYQYIQGISSFDTHQGVKGLEFPRVMVIIDDDESRGFTFSYNKLFGVTPKSETDIRNEQQGRDTTIDRTKRLFYVACSRAEDSLAIVYYTYSVAEAKEYIINSGWFLEDEITEL